MTAVLGGAREVRVPGAWLGAGLGDLRGRLARRTRTLASFAGRLELRDLRSGLWLGRLIGACLRNQAPCEPVASESERRRLAEAIIRRVAVESAAGGALAAGATTVGAVAMAQTQGVAAIWAMPLTGGAVFAELIGRAMLLVEAASEVAALWGVRFDPDDPVDLEGLLLVAFELAHRNDPDDPGREAVRRLAKLETHEGAELLGNVLAGSSIARNSLPFVGVPYSAWSAWRTAQLVGDLLCDYARGRRALDDAMAQLERAWRGCQQLAIEGIWFLFVADGRLDDRETLLLAHLLHARPEEVRAEIGARLVTDESGWLSRMERGVPARARAPMLRLLETAAAVDGALAAGESALLQRAADALGRPFRPAEVEELGRALD